MDRAQCSLERLPQVLARRAASQAQHYEDIAEGFWTPAVKVGRSSRWPSHETDALLAAHIAGATKDEIRSLVQHLVAERRRVFERFKPAA